jgi:hypothetical protein
MVLFHPALCLFNDLLLKHITGKIKMSLQDNLAAAKDVVATAQSQLDSANAALNVAQSAIDAAVPHLSVLAELEGYRNHLSSEIVGEFDALIAKARALF